MPYRPPPIAAADVEFLTELQRLADSLESLETGRLGRRILKHQARVRLGALAGVMPDAGEARNILRPRATAQDLAFGIESAIIRAVNAGGVVSAQHAASRTGLPINWPGAFRIRRGILDTGLGRRLWSWIQQQRAKIESFLINEQTTLLAAHLEIIIREQIPAKDAARLLRGVLGLNAVQAGWLFGWDKSWRASVASGAILPSRRLQLLAEARRNLATRRAADWARTHTMNALNVSQREIMASAVLQFPDKLENWLRENISMGDGAVCPYCRERHGWRAPLGGSYEDGSEGPPWPHTTTGLAIGCRCVERWVKEGEMAPGELPPLVRPRTGGRLQPAA